MSKTIDEKAVPSPAVPVEDRFYPGAKPDSPPVRSETPAVEAGAVQTEAATEPADTDTEPSDPKGKSPRVSFAELRTARDRAEAKAELLERQLAEARSERKEKAESLPAKVEAQGTEDPEPQEADFAEKPDGFKLYVRALARWEHRQLEVEAQEKVREASELAAAKDAETRSAQQLKDWNTKEAAMVSAHENYPQAFEAFLKVAQANPALAAAIFESEAGPTLAYRLGGSPGDLAKLAKLDARGILKAVAVLEAKLEAEAAKPPDKGSEKAITQAPKPLAPVSGKIGGPAKALSIEERFYGRT